MKTEEVIVREDQPVEVREQSDSSGILALITRAATDKNLDVEKMVQIVDLHERVLRREAEVAFSEAMNRLQPRLPRIKKNGKIVYERGGTILYAKYEDIVAEIGPLMNEEGFTASFTTELIMGPNGATSTAGFKVVCKVKHIKGHFELTEMILPIDTGGGKNAVQGAASTFTYGKRHTLCAALNIVTEGEDKDGNAFINDAQATEIADLMHEAGMTTNAESRRKFLQEFMRVEQVNAIQSRDFNKAKTALSQKIRKLAGGK